MKKFVFRTTRRITERGKKNCSCVKRLTSGVDHPLADRPRRGTVERGGGKKAAASTSKGGTKKRGEIRAPDPASCPPLCQSDYQVSASHPFVSFDHESLFPPTRIRAAPIYRREHGSLAASLRFPTV